MFRLKDDLKRRLALYAEYVPMDRRRQLFKHDFPEGVEVPANVIGTDPITRLENKVHTLEAEVSITFTLQLRFDRSRKRQRRLPR